MLRVVSVRVLLTGALALLAAGFAQAQPTTSRVSVGAGGAQGNFQSSWPAISADGRWVSFYSFGDNLVPGDTNSAIDTFVYDRQTKTTTRVSLGVGGVQAVDTSTFGSFVSSAPAISADGRWVAFMSGASNLVPGDTNGAPDVFVHDRQTGTTTRASVGPGGAEAIFGTFYSGSHVSISAEGRRVAFASAFQNLVLGDTNGVPDVFVRDLQAGTTTRVSVATGGAQGNAASSEEAISADGRWVVFGSAATNLVAGDTNGVADVFLRDIQTDTTTRISMASGGTQANGQSGSPSISADGRWVAFASAASNLVPGDTNGQTDVFVHDRQTGSMSRIPVGAGGAQGGGFSGLPAISGDGRWVTFISASAPSVYAVLLHDRQTGITTMASVPSGGTQAAAVPPQYPSISGDGRSVVFYSDAANLVVGDTNNRPDVFVHDHGDPNCNVTLGTTPASLGAAGGAASVAVTAGAGCAWTALSLSSWLGVTAGTSGTGSGSVSYGAAPNPSTLARTAILAVGGQWFTVTQAGLTPNCSYSLDSKATIVGAAGQTGLVQVSASCPWTATSSEPDWLTVTSANNATGELRYTVLPKNSPGVRTGTLTVATLTFTVTQAVGTLRSTLVNTANPVNGDCCDRAPALSADGRWLAFDSGASNLVPGDTNTFFDVFVYDTQTQTTSRVSVGLDGAESNGYSAHPVISADGRFVAFESGATNLVPGDTNGVEDVFVYDRQSGTTTRVNVGPGGSQANPFPGARPLGSYVPAISADGRWVAFESYASDLVAGDTNGVQDIFVHDRQTGTTTRVNVATGGGEANDASYQPHLSGDGRLVTFASIASNLRIGDTNDSFDIFVHDRQEGTTTPISLGIGGTAANHHSFTEAISADGRWVTFWSYASNLILGDTNNDEDVFMYDRQNGNTTRVGVGPADFDTSGFFDYAPAISADGRWVAFTSAVNSPVNDPELFLYDRSTGNATKVSGYLGHIAAFPAISVDGRWLAYMAAGPGDGYDSLYLYDRLAEARTVSVIGDLAFGTVVTGATATRPLTIANTGNSALTVTGLTYPAGFSGSWSGTLAPGAGVVVTVTFAPSQATTYSGTVTVVADQTSGTNGIAVSGTGVAPPAPVSRVIALSGTLTFGNVPSGTSATRTLRISNTGNTVLTVTGLGYPPGFGGAFSGTIAAGGFRDVTVTFTPTAITAYGGFVTVLADQTSGTSTISASGTGTSAPITLSASPAALNYGAVKAPGGTLGPTTPAQRVRLTQFGSEAVAWTATSDQPWLQITPASGTGSGSFTVSVLSTAGLLSAGTVTGTVTVRAAAAQNSAVIPVRLTLFSPSTSAQPSGVLDTPPNGTTGVTGSIAVTGWAVDDVAVARVRVLRNPVAGEGSGLVFIGDAVLVEGARPDVAAAFPTVPLTTRAGWGYLMLTNFLPGGGNGTFVIHAVADDLDGHSVELGKATITCANATAKDPFGAIDTPGQGETVGGSSYVNFGWVLAHAPSLTYPPLGDVRVLVDGTFQPGSPSGWAARPDLTSLFPAAGYPGVANAVAAYALDTTALADGVHTIAWIVTADNGAASGIGSRFFTVANGTGASSIADGSTAPRASLAGLRSLSIAAPEIAPIAPDEVNGAPLGRAPIIGRRTADPLQPYRGFATDSDGHVTVDSEELDRVELLLGVDPSATPGDQYAGFQRVGDALEPLPIGSRLDPASGIFTWQPGVGFLHEYDLTFVRSSAGRASARREVRIVLSPKTSNRVGPQVVIDLPSARTGEIAGPFAVGGWAIDRDAEIGTGVAAVHVWAYPSEGPPIFLGSADYGGSRPDVAAIFGQRFRDSAFGLTVKALPPGTYDVAVFASSPAGEFLPAAIVRVTVQ